MLHAIRHCARSPPVTGISVDELLSDTLTSFPADSGDLAASIAAPPSPISIESLRAEVAAARAHLRDRQEVRSSFATLCLSLQPRDTYHARHSTPSPTLYYAQRASVAAAARQRALEADAQLAADHRRVQYDLAECRAQLKTVAAHLEEVRKVNERAERDKLRLTRQLDESAKVRLRW